MCAASSAALYAVANRRSADTPATFASAKSRATSARMSSSSFFDVRWRVTSWLSYSLVQVTLASFHEFLGTSQNVREKVILRGHFLSELTCRKAGEIDLSSETAFSFPNRRCEFSLTHNADHQQVDVAPRMFLTARHGTINRSAVDPLAREELRSDESVGVRLLSAGHIDFGS